MIFLENARTTVRENVSTTVRANKPKNQLRILSSKRQFYWNYEAQKTYDSYTKKCVTVFYAIVHLFIYSFISSFIRLFIDVVAIFDYTKKSPNPPSTAHLPF